MWGSPEVEKFVDTLTETVCITIIKKIVEKGELPVEEIEEKNEDVIKELIKLGIIDYTDETKKEIKPLKRAYDVLS